MLDLTYIREHADEVKEPMAKLYAEAPIDEILELDKKRRTLLQEVEQLKQQRNVVSKEIGKTLALRASAGVNDAEEREAKKAEMRAVGDRIDELDAEVRDTEARLNDLMLRVPNLPDPSVPVGKDDSENVVTRVVGEPKTAQDFGFEPKPHWDLGRFFLLIVLVLIVGAGNLNPAPQPQIKESPTAVIEQMAMPPTATDTPAPTETPLPTETTLPTATSTITPIPGPVSIKDDFSTQNDAVWPDCKKCEWKDGQLLLGPYDPGGNANESLNYLVCAGCGEHPYYRMDVDATFIDGQVDRYFGVWSAFKMDSMMSPSS